VGTFPGGTILQFIACGFDPEIQVCWRARLQRLQGSESEGHIRFGAEMSTSEDFDDFFFDVVLTPAPPQDTLAVELTPARRDVTPVFAGYFNAALQWAGRCIYRDGQLVDSIPVARDDTVRLRLRVFYSPSGRPAPGASVRIVTSATDPIGAHQHFLGRPTGRFFLLDDVDRVDSSTAGVPGQLRLALAEAADTVVIYRTTGVSGVERLFAQASAGGQTRVAQDSLLVRIPGLVALGAGGSIALIGEDDVHPQRWRGTPGMIAALQTLGDRIQTQAAAIAALPPAQRPAGIFPDRLDVNDMSLPWGGLFDQFGTWHHPHKEHRRGTEADVAVPAGPDYDDFARLVRLVWVRELGHTIVSERQARNHFHLRF